MLYYRDNPLQSIRLCPFWERPPSVAVDMHNLTSYSMPFRMTYWIFWGIKGWNAFNYPWAYWLSYMFPPPALVPLVMSMFLMENVTGLFRLLILVMPCWKDAPWLPTVLSMLDISHQCPIIKDPIMDVSVGWVVKPLQSLHLTLWLLTDVCCVDKDSFPQSVRQWQGNSNINNKRLQVILERMDQLVCLRGCTKNVILSLVS